MRKFAFLTAESADDAFGKVRPPGSAEFDAEKRHGADAIQSMRGKDYNAGLRGVLFEARHYERMGAAIWLYGWLVLRQTHQQGEVGWVLGGSPISYREIGEETGFNLRTLERWMQGLRKHGYIETESVPAGVIVRITKAKKFPQGTRKSADPPRKSAGSSPQWRGANHPNPSWNQQNAAGIGSSSIERSKERLNTENFHKDFNSRHDAHKTGQQPTNPNLSCLGSNPKVEQDAPADFTARPHFQQQQKFLQEARLRLQLLRADREDAVRRELAVGSGPEVDRR
jgi:hypothetical protein